MTPRAFKVQFREGPYAWPGGYPMYLVTNDGAALCPSCVVAERWQILRAAHALAKDGYDHSGWCPEGFDVNWEDPELVCDQCGRLIESAYGEAQS